MKKAIEFKVGDIVYLSKKAVKNFYGHTRRLEMFDRRDREYWDSEDFVDFFNRYLGFESGELSGVVNTVRGDSIRVVFSGPLSLDMGYYEDRDLYYYNIEKTKKAKK
jgi:hypothetical protein